MDYPFYFNLCPDELELRRSLVVPEFVQSDHFPNSTLTKTKMLLKTKAKAVDVLVRALAIEKLQQDDPNASKFYEDTKDGTSSNE